MRKWIFSFWFLVFGVQLIAQKEKTFYRDTIDFQLEILKALNNQSQYLRPKKFKYGSEKNKNELNLKGLYIFNQGISVESLTDFINNDPKYQKFRTGLEKHIKGDSLVIPFDISVEDAAFNFNLNKLICDKITFRKFDISSNQHPSKTGIEFFPTIRNSKISSLIIVSELKPLKTNWHNRLIELSITNSSINRLHLALHKNEVVSITQNKIKELFTFKISPNLLNISNNDLQPFISINKQKTYDDFGEEIGLDTIVSSSNIEFIDLNCKSLRLENNSVNWRIENELGFQKEKVKRLKEKFFPISIQGNCNRFELLGNNLEVNINLNHLHPEKSILFRNNTFKKLGLNDFIFSETRNDLTWENLKNKKITSILGREVVLLGATKYEYDYDKAFNYNEEINSKNKRLATQLLRVYRNLFDIFKSNGDMLSANSCYTEMKEFELKIWEHEFKEDPNFQNYFRWKLNSFLSYFTDYGTNPAKAVIKSLWVILIFAIFYLFFPSDWDITNRAEFLNKWKALLSRKLKDESPKSPFAFYLSTVVFLLYTGMIHLLNALTLSLNAFTTLGFGDIPTHGGARYVTIVQGFIGWFLLTIFSVSLINQVLG